MSSPATSVQSRPNRALTASLGLSPSQPPGRRQQVVSFLGGFGVLERLGKSSPALERCEGSLEEPTRFFLPERGTGQHGRPALTLLAEEPHQAFRGHQGTLVGCPPV